MPLIPALEKQRQANHWGQPGLQSPREPRLQREMLSRKKCKTDNKQCRDGMGSFALKQDIVHFMATPLGDSLAV